MQILPYMSSSEVIDLVAKIMASCGGDINLFMESIEILLEHNVIRMRTERPIINFTNSFNRNLGDATANHLFRLTLPQLQLLTVKLQMPAWIVTTSGDEIDALEALALLCRRLAEPSRLYTIANEFERSVPSICRILRVVVNMLHSRFDDILYFNEPPFASRVDLYAAAIQHKPGLAGLTTCVGFVDGTKQYISRPSPRENRECWFSLQPVTNYPNIW
ncbi:hypothetical protein AC1031_021944 [Aphanomyces cochlioides]|nr:hypothetical protein AC1031_021944 [Aphanomyces cochlioides]